jgi:hypothetical protein
VLGSPPTPPGTDDRQLGVRAAGCGWWPRARSSTAAFVLLAELHQATARLLAKLGAMDLAWMAAERAYLAAERSGDPLLAAVSDFRLAHAFLSAGRFAQAQRVAWSLRWHSNSNGELAAALLSVWGGLNLVAAVIASRQGDRDLALEHLAEAETAAGWIGEDRNDYHTRFGPTNVALHSVAVSVELGAAARPGRSRVAARPGYPLSDQ